MPCPGTPQDTKQAMLRTILVLVFAGVLLSLSGCGDDPSVTSRPVPMLDEIDFNDGIELPWQTPALGVSRPRPEIDRDSVMIYARPDSIAGVESVAP
jgi:hypothetical protein